MTDDVADPVIVVLGIIVTAEEGADLVTETVTGDEIHEAETEREAETSRGTTAAVIVPVIDIGRGELAMTGVVMPTMTDATVEVVTVIVIRTAETASSERQGKANNIKAATVISTHHPAVMTSNLSRVIIDSETVSAEMELTAMDGQKRILQITYACVTRLHGSMSVCD